MGHTLGPVQQAFGGGLDHGCSTSDELYGDEDDENANAWNGPASSSTASKKRNAESAFQGPATVLSQIANALNPGRLFNLGVPDRMPHVLETQWLC